MTIKTPAQIAEEAMGAFSIIDQDEDFNPNGDVEQVSADFIRDQIIAAIEADRAQLREVKAQAWREGWDASERFGYLVGVLETPLNPYLEADDDGEPTSDPEAEDYGKYLDQQFWGDH